MTSLRSSRIPYRTIFGYRSVGHPTGAFEEVKGARAMTDVRDGRQGKGFELKQRRDH